MFFKLLIFLVLEIMACFFAMAQEVEMNNEFSRMPEFGEFTVGISPVILDYDASGLQAAGILNMQFYLSKWFSIDAGLGLARDYVHIGPGVIALPFWLFYNINQNENDEGTSLNRETFQKVIFISVVTLLSLEHFSLHIPLNERSALSPYLSLLRYRSAYLSDGSMPVNVSHEQFCFASGVKLDNYCGKFLISPFAEYNIGYQDHKSGFIGGVAFCYRFRF